MVLLIFFRLQAFAFEHVVEVGVAAEVELVGAVDLDAAVAEEAREHAVHDRGPDLGFDVVATIGAPARRKRLPQYSRGR